MALVGYSDSEDSDNETQPTPKPTSKPTDNKSSKPSFQKVVNKSNPRQIRVNLPGNASTSNDDEVTEERPAKKPRTGGGGLFSDFDSFLPAPKNTKPPPGVKKGIGRGINLKTGAVPAFSRETAEPENDTTEVEPVTGQGGVRPSDTEPPAPAEEKSKEEVKLVGKPNMFRPLSVANKKKKKPIAPRVPVQDPAIEDALKKAKQESTSQTTDSTTKPKPKPALFSFAATDTSDTKSSNNEYLLPETTPVVQSSYNNQAVPQPVPFETAPQNDPPQAQSLDSIADELNLSESARRQLFGRKGKNAPDLSNINVTSFNTEKEYKTAEALRASGETVQHNPIKTIAPGKHNLKQLINNAVSQQDAMEEHFATGKRNRKEAGNKYGW